MNESLSKNIINKGFKCFLAILLLLILGRQSFYSQNINLKTYSNITIVPAWDDLDAQFVDVIEGGVVYDSGIPNFTFANNDTSALPTTVAGFAGAQMVWVTHFDSNTITVAQADALINYVKGGGILIANLENSYLTSGVSTAKYIGEALVCKAGVNFSAIGNTSTVTVNPAPAYHPGGGNMLLNSTPFTATNAWTTGSSQYLLGVPSENAILGAGATNATPCGTNVRILDMILPAYPGASNSCGVNGFAIISMEVQGALNANRVTNNINQNYAALIKDFLYNSANMATRRLWSTNSSNINSTCTPALLCSAPTITATTPASRCGTGTVNLGATASAGTINWYSAATGGTSLGTGTSFTTPSISSTTTYYVDATNAGCTTATRTAVIATVSNTSPALPTITKTVSCTSPETATISNYSASNTYIFTPSGPSVGAGGVISGLISGTSYTVVASNGCLSGSSAAFSVSGTDSDGDGIYDSCDIDDDNDGIVDAIESPSCYYTATEASVLKSVSTGLANNGGTDVDLPFMRDGITTTVPANDNIITLNAAVNGSVIYTVEYTAPTKLSSLTHYGTTFGTSATARIEGSNNGTTWVSLMSAATAATASPKTFTVNQNSGFYRYYRIVKVAGTSTPAITTYEIQGSANATGYVASSNPKPTCTGTDTDNDGIPNNLDLDSDGDGCSDAKESSVTPTASLVASGVLSNAKFSFVSPANDANNDGLFDGATQSTYSLYATTNTLNVCTDTDADGIMDIVDIDDDNDGIIDEIESPSCYYTSKEASVIKSVSTQLANDDAIDTDLPFMHDGVTVSVAASNNVITANEAVNGSVIYTVEYTAPTKLSSLSHYGTTFGTSATARIEASNNGLSWTSLMSAATAATAATNTFTVNQNSGFYRYYRIVKVAGSTTPAISTFEIQGIADDTGYVASSNPKPTCTGNDTDNDGVPNQKDLDSDGDGCSDAKEASVTPTASLVASGVLSNAKFSFVSPANDANNDGLFDGASESTYKLYATEAALNACTDTDGDGIIDVKDIDDDNDGIVDAVESPSCFYTITEATTIKSVSTQLANDDAIDTDLPFMHDAVTTTVAANNNVITANEAINGAIIYTVEYTAPTKLSSLSHYGTTFGTSATARIEASNNGSSWTSLMSAATAATGTTNTFTVNQNSGFYKYYRIVKVAGTTAPAISTYEVQGTADSSGYIQSANPKPNCSGSDIDGDTIPNHLDLDSDGDGCSDAKESGVAPFASLSWSAGGTLANALFIFVSPTNDANNDGLFDGATQTSYKQYAVNNALNVCTDSDGDGIGDVIDIDDDNDGIVDAVESPNCYYTAIEASIVKSISTELANNNGSNVDLHFMYDGTTTTVAANDNTISSGYAVNGSVIYTIEYPTKVKLSSVLHYGTTFGTSSTAIIEGSNDGNLWTSLMNSPTAATAATKTFTVNQNSGFYKYYRIVKIAGTTVPAITTYEIQGTVDTAGYIASANPKSSCTATDTNNDGTPNNLDLDSDGDGCSDAKESGVTPFASLSWSGGGMLANALFIFVSPANDANNDGLFDGATQTSYKQYAIDNTINLCQIETDTLDTDGDGIRDVVDIDDDNDGIVDAIECPSCFYGDKIKSISTQFANNQGVNIDLPFLHNDIATNVSLQNNIIPANTVYNNYPVFIVEYPMPVKIISLSHYGTTFGTGSTARIEGSNDGDSWTSLMTAPVGTTGAIKTFTVNQNSGLYKFYRIVKVAGGFAHPAITSYEIIGVTDTASYVPSANPKSVCTTDTDGDGILNHHDLDSDGDGCSDAKEAVVTPTASLVNDGVLSTAKFSFISPANDTNNDGLFDGATQSYYELYASDGLLNLCADSDLDGIGDLIDLDDDNDGILDIDECSYSSSPMNTSEFGGTFGSITGTNRDLQQSPSLNYSYGGTGINALNAGGRYVVSSYSNSNNLHSSNSHWQNLFGHTTGSVDDAYLAVNGSISQGIFYNEYVTLQPYSSYKLSLWAINAIVDPTYTGTPANIQIRLIRVSDSYVAASFSTGDLYPTPKALGSDVLSSDWHNAAGVFKTGTDTQYRIEVLNNSLSDADNDFAIDDISISLLTCPDYDGDGIPNYLDLDSDNDGCSDAMEGDANIISSDLVASGGSLSVGTGSTALNQNLCASSNCVDANGIPTIVNGGQGIGDSRNATINSQCSISTSFCYKPKQTIGTTIDSNHGITALGRAGDNNDGDNTNDWPMIRKGAWTVLEAKTKGFVINRVKFNTSNQPVADDGVTLVITSPVEGMAVYDVTNSCLKVYTSIDGGVTFGWYCMNVQACPD